MKQSLRNTKTGYITRIEDGVLYFEDCAQCDIEDRDAFEDCIAHEKSIRLLSLESGWYQHEWSGDVLLQSDIDFELTLRSELRSGQQYWYAYRRVAGTLYKRYVGMADQVTTTRLVEIARKLPTKYFAASEVKRT